MVEEDKNHSMDTIGHLKNNFSNCLVSLKTNLLGFIFITVLKSLFLRL